MKNLSKEILATIYLNGVAGRGPFSLLKKETAVVVPNQIPRDICERIIDKINQIVQVENHPRVWKDDKGSDTRIFCFENDMPDYLGYFGIDDKIKSVDAYTGRTTRSFFLMANRVIPVPDNLGSGGGLHRDSPFSNQVKCIWYLSDVNEENGPFQFIPHTNTNALKLRNIYPLGKTRFSETATAPTAVTAKAGSLLICDTKCIHGGKPIQDGARYAVTLYTLPKKDGIKQVLVSSGIDPDSVLKNK